MFGKKAAAEIRRLIKSCNDFQVLCKVDENELPYVVVAGSDSTGKKWLVTTNIDEGWVQEAACADQFIAQVVDETLALIGNSSESLCSDKLAVLHRVYLQGTLLPLLNRD